MDRRNFVKLGFFAGAGAAINNNLLAAEHHGDLKISSSIIEADVTELQALMQAGKLTATALTESYLSRIKAIDKSGPHLNAIIELNPDALSIARELDLERKKSGPRGPLHGIPVLIKDNIATADRMQTTAGSLALLGAKAPRDAFLVKQLRKAGAIILGKTNLSEWANLRSSRSTSGWSGRIVTAAAPAPGPHRQWLPAWRRWQWAPKPTARSCLPHRCAVWSVSSQPWV